MNSDLIEVLVALALIFACAWFQISMAQPAKRERAPKPKRQRAPRPERRARPARLEVSGAAPPAETATLAMPAAIATRPAETTAVAVDAPAKTATDTRPRIFTGESADPTIANPASKKALKLAAGMTALAAAGAIGLLALVGAMIKLFQRIGG